MWFVWLVCMCGAVAHGVVWCGVLLLTFRDSHAHTLAYARPPPSEGPSDAAHKGESELSVNLVCTFSEVVEHDVQAGLTAMFGLSLVLAMAVVVLLCNRPMDDAVDSLPAKKA